MAGPLNGGNLTSVLIPTAVQTSSDLLQYWTSMTCLYDTQWIAENDRVTLPIAFFHVTGMREVGKPSVSKKRVLLYEPQSDNTAAEQANIVRPSVLRSIVDNAVRDQKEYVLNVILPFKPVGMYVKSGLSVMVDTLSMFTTLLGKEDFSSYINAAFAAPMALLDTVSAIVSTIDKLPNMSGVAYINKNSLEAMWDRTHFLCMKMWTGYDYKFVMITNLEVEKKGIEDDVFRATLQVQEMPVLTVTRPNTLVLSRLNRNLVVKSVSVVQKALSEVLTKFTGVEDAVK